MLWAHCGNSSTNPGDMPGLRAWPPSASGDTQGEPRQHTRQHLSEELNQLHLAARPTATWPRSQPVSGGVAAFCLTNMYKTPEKQPNLSLDKGCTYPKCGSTWQKTSEKHLSLTVPVGRVKTRLSPQYYTKDVFTIEEASLTRHFTHAKPHATRSYTFTRI